MLALRGVARFPTPVGVFSIQRRVPNETMDSMTLGIPHNSPYGYLVKNVLYTQYFTPDGATYAESEEIAPGVSLDYDTEGRVIGVEVRADLRMHARELATLALDLEALAAELVHIGGGPADIAHDRPGQGLRNARHT